MIVPFAKVYNASSLWLPSDDADRDAIVISETPVKFSHIALPFRRQTPTIAIALLWLHGTHRPDTMRSYRNDEVPYTGIPRRCGRRLFTVKLFMREFLP